MLSPVDDVLDTLAEVGIDRIALLASPWRRRSRRGRADPAPAGRFPAAEPPGWITHRRAHADLRAFIETENAALARGDLGDAVEANLTWWVDGPRREAGDVDPTVRELVRLMQRRPSR